MKQQLVVSLSDQIETDEVVRLHRAHGWSSAEVANAGER
jgi:hypothetical protein